MAKQAVASEGEKFWEKKFFLDGYRVTKYSNGFYDMKHYEESYSGTDSKLTILGSGYGLKELIASLQSKLDGTDLSGHDRDVIKDFLNDVQSVSIDEHDSMDKLINSTWRISENPNSGLYVAEMAKIDPHGLKDWEYVAQGDTLYELMLNLENFDPNRRCTDSDQQRGYHGIMKGLREKVQQLEGTDVTPVLCSKWFKLTHELQQLLVYEKGRLTNGWSLTFTNYSPRKVLEKLQNQLKSYDPSDKNQRERSEDLMVFIQKFNPMYLSREGFFESDYHYLIKVTAGDGFQLYSSKNHKQCLKYCKTALEMLTHLNNQCRKIRFNKGPEYLSYAKLMEDLRAYLKHGEPNEVILQSKYYRVEQHEDGTYILMAKGYGTEHYYQEDTAKDMTGMLLKCRDLVKTLDIMDARQCDVSNDLKGFCEQIENYLSDKAKSDQYECFGTYTEERCSGSNKCLICAYEHDCIKRSAELQAQKPKPTSKRREIVVPPIDASSIKGILDKLDLTAPIYDQATKIETKSNKEEKKMTENKKNTMMDRMVSQFYPQQIAPGEVALTMGGRIAVRRSDGDYVCYNPATETIENQMDLVFNGDQMDRMCILMPTAAAYLNAGDIIKEKQTYYQVIEIKNGRIRSVNLNSSVSANLKIETNILTGQKMYQKVYSLFSMMQNSMMGGGMMAGMGMNPMMMAMMMDKFGKSDDPESTEGSSMADMLMPMMCMNMASMQMPGQQNGQVNPAMNPMVNPMMNPMMMAMMCSGGSMGAMMPMMCMMGMQQQMMAQAAQSQGGQPTMAGNFCGRDDGAPCRQCNCQQGEVGEEQHFEQQSDGEVGEQQTEGCTGESEG